MQIRCFAYYLVEFKIVTEKREREQQSKPAEVTRKSSTLEEERKSRVFHCNKNF